jgi:hypothetical protein
MNFTDLPGYGLAWRPGVLMTHCAIVDYFEDYIAFQPAGDADNMYAPLGRIYWDWSASADRVPPLIWGDWMLGPSTVHAPTKPDGSLEFPYWERVYFNTGGE